MTRAGFKSHTPSAERVIVDAVAGGGEVVLVDPDTLPRFGELAIRVKVRRQEAVIDGAEIDAVPHSGSICVLRCPPNSCLSPLNVLKLADEFHRHKSKFETSFHNLTPQKDDPFSGARVAAEWGFSSFPGGNTVQVHVGERSLGVRMSVRHAHITFGA